MNLRRATEKDLLLLYDWANDSEVRKAAFNSRTIGMEDHSSWFLRKLTRSDSDIYIMEFENIPVGQIRFDEREERNSYLIDYSIDLKYRGKGFGSKIIELGMKAQMDKFRKDLEFIALVKNQNISSRKCFDKIGFRQDDRTEEFITYKYAGRYEK